MNTTPRVCHLDPLDLAHAVEFARHIDATTPDEAAAEWCDLHGAWHVIVTELTAGPWEPTLPDEEAGLVVVIQRPHRRPELAPDVLPMVLALVAVAASVAALLLP